MYSSARIQRTTARGPLTPFNLPPTECFSREINDLSPPQTARHLIKFSSSPPEARIPATSPVSKPPQQPPGSQYLPSNLPGLNTSPASSVLRPRPPPNYP
ncbi:hypothetical protein RRG08_018875 [Elysia crispata]|uniref:Uncharacterized protein n=1 Tax=Elysia crispata TaxID=231223 RepID=A0AAE1DVG7_9GAST|nr:hypothetical protein RRG08_018875 [Elysia crispata]